MSSANGAGILLCECNSAIVLRKNSFAQLLRCEFRTQDTRSK
jgi:hypothetical protein